jgi:small subunit ribosomal protein S21
VQVLVRDSNVDQALKALKKKMQRGHFPRDEAPRSLRKTIGKKSKREGRGRSGARKLARKRLQREGLLPMKNRRRRRRRQVRAAARAALRLIHYERCRRRRQCLARVLF